jgi:PSP1 C-terminal conserved region
MGDREYLLSYGNVGDFGRFRSALPHAHRRDDRVVVRSPRGQELGVVMRPASPEHCRLLTDQFVGQILRVATEGDMQLAERMRQRSQQLFDDGRQLVRDLELPMEILDAEILLDGRQAVLHHLRWADCDPRPLMDPLAQRYRLLITLHDLALPGTTEAEEHEEHAGCGNGGCGSGGCGSCRQGNCASCLNARGTQEDVSTRPFQANSALVVETAALLEGPIRVPLL